MQIQSWRRKRGRHGSKEKRAFPKRLGLDKTVSRLSKELSMGYFLIFVYLKGGASCITGSEGNRTECLRATALYKWRLSPALPRQITNTLKAEDCLIILMVMSPPTFRMILVTPICYLYTRLERS